MTRTRRAMLLAGLGLLPLPGFAQPHGRGGGNGRGNGGRGHGGGPPGSLGSVELNAVQGWLGGNPGFHAQPLPPGIAKRAVPPDLLVMLPRRRGYEYVMVGTSLVLVAIATGVVTSVLADALRR